jgi:hypothetical protein
MKVVVVSFLYWYWSPLFTSLVATEHDDHGCQVASTGKAILSPGVEELKLPAIE